MYVVYEIILKTTGELLYIGSSYNLDERILRHCHNMIYGRGTALYMWLSVNLGEDNKCATCEDFHNKLIFNVLENNILTKDNAFEQEQYYIDKLNPLLNTNQSYTPLKKNNYRRKWILDNITYKTCDFCVKSYNKYAYIEHLKTPKHITKTLLRKFENIHINNMVLCELCVV